MKHEKVNSVIFVGKCNIGKNVTILPFCIIENSTIEDGCIIGPFAHIRSNCVIQKNCKIGNFCEIKNSVIKENSKICHHAYIGDCTINENCNIGAGVIICNFDGRKKHSTIIGKNCFIGSNSELISPIQIGENCFIGAGSTVRKSLPNNTFYKKNILETIKENKMKKEN